MPSGIGWNDTKMTGLLHGDRWTESNGNEDIHSRANSRRKIIPRIRTRQAEYMRKICHLVTTGRCRGRQRINTIDGLEVCLGKSITCLSDVTDATIAVYTT